MAVAARQLDNDYVYTRSSTMRVYTHRQMEMPQVQPEQEELAKVAPVQRNEAGILKKLMVTCGILVAAAAVLVLLVRYAVIAEQYAVVNDYKETIEENYRAMAELEVQLNSAVSLEEAREAALAAGLSHPTAAQIIHIDGAGISPTH